MSTLVRIQDLPRNFRSARCACRADARLGAVRNTAGRASVPAARRMVAGHRFRPRQCPAIVRLATENTRRRTSPLTRATCRNRPAGYRSVAGSMTGLTSMTGVLSSASSGRTRIRSSWTATMRTRCSPMGVGPVGGTGAEHPGGWPGRVITRPGDQHAAVGPVPPGQYDDLSASGKVTQTVSDVGLEDQPGGRCALVALPWCLRPVGQRPADGHHLMAGHGRRHRPRC